MEKLPSTEITGGVHDKVKAAISALEDKINQVLDIQEVNCDADGSTNVCEKVTSQSF